jgi:hypothetical protein
MYRLAISTVVLGTCLALSACSGSSSSPTSPTSSPSVIATSSARPAGLVPAASISFKEEASSEGFRESFPVIKDLTKIRTANLCDTTSYAIVPIGGCPYLNDGYAMYSVLFDKNNSTVQQMKYCRTDSASGVVPQSSPCSDDDLEVYELDVFPIPKGAEPFALRWADAVYGCDVLLSNVKVGNTWGTECDLGKHGQIATYFVIHKGKLYVVNGGGRFAAQFRDGFTLID